MNERIQKLIVQATKVVEPNDPDYRHEIFDKEKFAELIVRACVDYAFSDEQEQKRMLEHFGVE